MESLSSIFDLIQILGRLPQAKILCLGDVMLDRYVYGSIDRISPEAPIPVMQLERQNEMLGGAGNVARNLSSLGVSTILISVVGGDAAGTRIKELSACLPGVSSELIADNKRQTTVKTRYVSGNQQMLRVDDESRAPIHEILIEQLLQKIKSHLPGCGTVILSDYAKGVLAPKLVVEIIKLARAERIPVLVDPKGADYAAYRGASILSPNLKELCQASGKNIKTDEDVKSVGGDLIRQLDLHGLLATRGKDGMTLILESGASQHFPAQAREVFDVSGAGDTSIAVLAAAVAARANFADAAYLANTAAGIVVGKLGTAVVQLSELDEALMDHHGRSKTKLFAKNALLDRIEIWRHQGYRIGFTNGCFDLIHPGHISLLCQARAACDRLIVAINTDDSVKRLKGAARPIQNQDSRATVLSSMDNVDAVIMFNDDTPIELIGAIRPDVLVKGADYTIDRVVGADIVQSYGGKILLATLEEGFSTSGTVRKIAGV